MASKVAQDIITGPDNDLYINPKTGDFSIGASDNQHIMDILQADAGWFKQFPKLGAGVRRLLKAKFNSQRVESTIKQQLESDGYQLGRPRVSLDSNGRAIIQPNAKRIRF